MSQQNIEKLLAKVAPCAKKNILEWLNAPLENEIKEKIIDLLEHNPQKAENLFYKKLSFGTAGARGVMDLGSNRMNTLTISFMTQGLANYLKRQFKQPSVFIGFDSRNNSETFAKETAMVLSGNGIFCYLFSHLRPTPLLSFAVREKKCCAGIMITASHNPPEYNGYKVYWSDGGQVLPPHDKAIIAEVNEISSPLQVKKLNLPNPLVQFIDTEVDEKYLERLKRIQSSFPSSKNLKIVYSNLHGTGLTVLPKALQNWGYNNISVVEKQKSCDGNFPNAPYPNPEDKKALAMGIEQMINEKADIFIATDPDADRIALTTNHKGTPYTFSGNEIAALILHFLIENSPPSTKKRAVIKSIVTTDLIRKIAKKHDLICFDVLTGFKYIAEKILKFETENSYQFFFGAEESLGYLVEDFVRDKDAISAACVIAEAAQKAKDKKEDLKETLEKIYEKYGVFKESVISISFPETKEGSEKMKSFMEKLRLPPLKEVAGFKILEQEDFLLSPKEFPKTDLIRLKLENASIIIRPSGTEPKIKIYFFTHCIKTKIKEGEEHCLEKLKLFKQFFKKDQDV